MRTPKTKTPALLALATMLTIGLSACGSTSGNDSTSQDVYDFTGPSAKSTSQVVVEVPQELIEANSDYSENRFIERVTVKPMEINSTELCAMTLDYELLGDPVEDLYKARGDRGEDLPEKERRQHAIGSALGQWPAPQLSEPNPDKPVKGVYYSEKDRVVTVIDKCAATPNSDNAVYEIEFTLGREADGVRTLAIAPVGVTRDGTVFAAGGEVNDWQRSPDGQWSRQ